MRYVRVEPSTALLAHVECYWFLTETPGAAEGEERPIFPDGSMEIVLNLADPFLEIRPDAPAERQPLRMVVGQMDRAVRIRPTGAVDLVGVRLTPAACRPVLGMPGAELRGHLLDLESLLPRVARALGERLGETPSIRRRAAILDEALAGLMRSPTAPRNVSHAVSALVRSNGRTEITALASSGGMSARHLERLFNEWVGVPPKLFARILRFQSVLGAMTANREDTWVDVALAHGYFDQAHLARDFRAFAGAPPARALDALDRFTETFTRRRVASLQDTGILRT